ncbi:MAG TPA: CopL family metal-binding regulatory protein, partial [Lysobacter sp.]|nr:CopL family metal-binding regulatory protein [Lysobacter sp.]
MSAWSLLLRVLLSLTLILNGSGFAVASTHMSKAIAASAHAMHPPVHAQASQSPCHGDHASMMVSHHHDAERTVDQSPDQTESHLSKTHPSKAHPSKSHSDCCQSGACRCVCNHASTAAIAMAFVRDVLIVRSDASRPVKPGRPAPALP